MLFIFTASLAGWKHVKFVHWIIENGSSKSKIICSSFLKATGFNCHSLYIQQVYSRLPVLIVNCFIGKNRNVKIDITISRYAPIQRLKSETTLLTFRQVVNSFHLNSCAAGIGKLTIVIMSRLFMWVNTQFLITLPTSHYTLRVVRVKADVICQHGEATYVPGKHYVDRWQKETIFYRPH